MNENLHPTSWNSAFISPLPVPRFPRADVPIFNETVRKLAGLELLRLGIEAEANGTGAEELTDIRSTERLRAFVRMLCDTPLPQAVDRPKDGRAGSVATDTIHPEIK